MPGFGGAERESSAPVASVPASVGQPQVAPQADPYQLIANIVSPQLATAATTPIAGAHAVQVPSAFSAPIAPFQPRQLDQRQVVGKKAARIQGIGNAITGATNAIGQVVTKEAQMKQNQIRDAAQKVIMAQQGIDEAKQLLDSAHANGDTAGVQKATEMMQQNQQARDAIFADPKMRKALSKGFDISYTDPESNKTEEHAAVQEAMKNAKTWQEKRQAMQAYQQKQQQTAGAAAGAAFEKSMPQGWAANVPAQQRLAIAQTTQKELGQLLRTTMAATIRADASTQNSIRQQQTELMKQAHQIANQNYQRAENFKQRQQLLGIQNAYATKRLYTELGIAVKREKAILEMKDADPDTVFKASEQSAREWDGREQAADSRVVAANNALALLTSNGKGPGDPDYEKANAAVQQASDDLDMIQDQADFSLNQFNLKLASVGKEPIPGPQVKTEEKKNATDNTTKPGTGNNFTDYFGSPEASLTAQ